MEQYYRLFSSYRRPGVAKDEQVLNLDRDPFDPEYVIVACNDQRTKEAAVEWWCANDPERVGKVEATIHQAAGTPCSSTQAEIYAVIAGLNWLDEHAGKGGRVMIISDSQSCLQAIKGLSKTPRKMLRKLEEEEMVVKLIWVPAHCGLAGNELADDAAKVASTRAQGGIRVPASSSKKFIQSKLGRDDDRSNRRSKETYGEQGVALQPTGLSKEEAVDFRRFRSGHGSGGTQKTENRQVTDLFLAKAGVNAVRIVSVMAKPKELEEMDFADIRKLIIEKTLPKKKLVIAERSKFMSMRQEPTESVQAFAQRLWDAARFCEFDHPFGLTRIGVNPRYVCQCNGAFVHGSKAATAAFDLIQQASIRSIASFATAAEEQDQPQHCGPCAGLSNHWLVIEALDREKMVYSIHQRVETTADRGRLRKGGNRQENAAEVEGTVPVGYQTSTMSRALEKRLKIVGETLTFQRYGTTCRRLREGKSLPNGSRFYVLDAMFGCNDLLTEEAIYGQLRRIVKDAGECAAESANRPPPRLGVLTSMQRDLWARAREHLAQNETNRANLELIERSCFIVCLDKDSNQQEQQAEAAAVGDAVSNDVRRSLQLLHGMGSRHNGANRWYDKTMQFVISADGNSGLNYEHSVSEGIAVIKLIEHILAYMEEMKAKRMRRFPSICELPHPQKLEWHVDEETEAFIEQGLLEIDRLADNLDLYILRFEKFGREYPKKANMSPDSFVQLALQLAHYKVHKYLVPTYESASIRRFHLGRVDVIHSASMAALHWVRAMEGDSEATTEQKLRLLREAIESQTEHMLKTILGHGMDNHMLGLRITAETVLGQLPDLFTDPVYVECNQFRLSTSQRAWLSRLLRLVVFLANHAYIMTVKVSTTTDALICYGAVVPNGYGAAYNLHTDSIAVCVSCWRDCPNKDVSARRYAEALAASLEDMHAMIEANLDLARANSVATDVKIPEESPDLGAACSVNGEALG
uniref:Choline O-acetyltransferase n=1 Tax=Macrostomum lignano TaxID=282301 RepID=A0A1I8HYW7_9PLAT